MLGSYSHLVSKGIPAVCQQGQRNVRNLRSPQSVYVKDTPIISYIDITFVFVVKLMRLLQK